MSFRDEPWPAGTPCWVDLGTPDASATKAFYADVLGWSYTGGDDPQYGGYLTAQVKDHAAAGIGPQQDPSDPPRWTTYFASDKVDEHAEKITAAGGTVLMPPMDVGPMGRMVIARDPQGAVFGVWQAGMHYGATVVNEPGGLVWSQGEMPDPDAARKFYAAVFGFVYPSFEGGGTGHTLFGTDPEHPYGGIGPSRGDSAPGWLTFFSVADTDAAVAAGRRHGGQVLSEPTDTPYGRMAVLTDQFGARFALMSTPSEGWENG